MIKEAIDRILELSKPELIEVEGRLYSPYNHLHHMNRITCIPLEVNTLTGLVDYIYLNIPKEKNESFDKINVNKDIVVHVSSPTEVIVMSRIHETWMNRHEYIKASAIVNPSIPNNFGNFMSIENFIIWLQSKFEETQDKLTILKIIGNIRSEVVATSQDDGITQTVVARSSVGRIENVEFNPIVNLAPYRTFREVEQPISSFLFRMKPGKEGELPTCGLFEADGNQWKLTAINIIKKYLEKKLPVIPILA